jgi:hypothetical protein
LPFSQARSIRFWILLSQYIYLNLNWIIASVARTKPKHKTSLSPILLYPTQNTISYPLIGSTTNECTVSSSFCSKTAHAVPSKGHASILPKFRIPVVSIARYNLFVIQSKAKDVIESSATPTYLENLRKCEEFVIENI